MRQICFGVFAVIFNFWCSEREPDIKMDITEGLTKPFPTH